jgi:Xaa-Pro aminopeptidase
MTRPDTGRTEATGTRFSLGAMRAARTLSQRAVSRIASGMHPGMTHAQAHELAMATLQKLGMERNWHPIVIRFGEDTLKIFRETSDPDRVLGAQDIFFVDIGPVWEGHEGDAGDTFVMGDDPQMHACAEAARVLWQDVAERWRADRLSGQALYAYAAERAEAMGWRLNLDIKGHRVCDFPHAIYQAGKLGDFGLCPATGIWILEIQIAHPTRPFGAFYEDLLMADDVPPANDAAAIAELVTD